MSSDKTKRMSNKHTRSIPRSFFLAPSLPPPRRLWHAHVSHYLGYLWRQLWLSAFQIGWTWIRTTDRLPAIIKKFFFLQNISE